MKHTCCFRVLRSKLINTPGDRFEGTWMYREERSWWWWQLCVRQARKIKAEIQKKGQESAQDWQTKQESSKGENEEGAHRAGVCVMPAGVNIYRTYCEICFQSHTCSNNLACSLSQLLSLSHLLSLHPHFTPSGQVFDEAFDFICVY